MWMCQFQQDIVSKPPSELAISYSPMLMAYYTFYTEQNVASNNKLEL